MSTTNLNFFYFFSPAVSTWAASGKRTIARAVFRTEAAAGSGYRAFSCVTEQLCPESRAAGDPSLPGSGCCQVQAEQLHAIPTAASPAGPRQPEQLFVFWTRSRLSSLPTPNNYSLFAAGTWDAWFKPEQSFGLAARPGTHQPRKANNGWFLRV